MICTVYFITLFNTVLSQSLTNTIHRTQAASEKINDLWCYQCQTMDDGDLCSDLAINQTNFRRKCKADEFICMIKRFSYTLSTENSTSTSKLWSLERRCASTCQPDCIVIGERTKLYACTSCCEYSLCNTGKGNASRLTTGLHIILLFLKLFII